MTKKPRKESFDENKHSFQQYYPRLRESKYTEDFIAKKEREEEIKICEERIRDLPGIRQTTKKVTTKNKQQKVVEWLESNIRILNWEKKYVRRIREILRKVT